MNDRHDRPEVDLERDLVRYMAERRITRRMLLEQMAKVGRLRGPGARSSRPARARPHRPPRHPRRRPRRRPRPPRSAAATAAATATPSPTPVPTPERPSCTSTTGTYYIGETTKQDFEKKYGIKVTYDKFPDASTQTRRSGATARAAGTTSPIRPRPTSRPLARDGVIAPLDHSLIPNIKNLGPIVAGPDLRPRQQALGAVLLVDDGDRLGSGQGQGGHHELGGPVGREVQGQARDAVRPAGGLRRRRVPTRAASEHDLGRRPRRGPGAARDAEAAPSQVHGAGQRGGHDRPDVDDPGLVR